MEHKILVCNCSSLEHQIAFSYDEEEKILYIRPHLVNYRNFFQRVWVAIKYIFGYRSRYGEFDEILLLYEGQKELYDIVSYVIKNNEK